MERLEQNERSVSQEDSREEWCPRNRQPLCAEGSLLTPDEVKALQAASQDHFGRATDQSTSPSSSMHARLAHPMTPVEHVQRARERMERVNAAHTPSKYSPRVHIPESRGAMLLSPDERMALQKAALSLLEAQEAA